jgi:16S rRNA (guanine1207-N2)-methyltransferase
VKTAAASQRRADAGGICAAEQSRQRRCGLYHGRLEKQPAFDPVLGRIPLDNLTIKTLPGVFSRDGLDVGSQLLLSTLTPHTKGKVLDVGCGAGVLATVLASHSPKVRLAVRRQRPGG